jgi:DNA-binding winged helix-turn-helix (wHTH) protein
MNAITVTGATTDTQLVFNHETRILTDGPASTQLARQEAALFHCLAKRFPRVATRGAILAAMYDGDGPDTGTKAIDICLLRLRRRLREAGIPDCITTIWGRGLQLVVPVAIVPDAKSSGAVVFEGRAVAHLRELIARAADRPADALLAERVRQAAAWDGRRPADDWPQQEAPARHPGRPLPPHLRALTAQRLDDYRVLKGKGRYSTAEALAMVQRPVRQEARV